MTKIICTEKDCRFWNKKICSRKTMHFDGWELHGYEISCREEILTKEAQKRNIKKVCDERRSNPPTGYGGVNNPNGWCFDEESCVWRKMEESL